MQVKKVLVVCLLSVIVVFSGCALTRTALDYEGTWVSSNPDLSFSVKKGEVSEGWLKISDSSIRVYVVGRGGSPIIDILDADKDDSSEYYTSDIILVEGSGYWENDNYVVDVITDNIVKQKIYGYASYCRIKKLGYNI